MNTGKGGYKIIDFKSQNLTTTATVIDGIYNAIENSYGKTLLLSNLVLDGVEKNDVFAVVNNVSGNYTVSAYGVTITITSENSVTTSGAAAIALKTK